MTLCTQQWMYDSTDHINCRFASDVTMAKRVNLKVVPAAA